MENTHVTRHSGDPTLQVIVQKSVYRLHLDPMLLEEATAAEADKVLSKKVDSFLYQHWDNVVRDYSILQYLNGIQLTGMMALFP